MVTKKRCGSAEQLETLGDPLHSRKSALPVSQALFSDFKARKLRERSRGTGEEQKEIEFEFEYGRSLIQICLFPFLSAAEKSHSRCGRESVLGRWFEDLGGCILFFQHGRERGRYFVLVGLEANKVTQAEPREV